MDVVTFTDPAAFAAGARPVIERHPRDANILATVTGAAARGLAIRPLVGFLIQDGDRPVAAAMQTPPYNLLITPLPADHRAGGVAALAEAIGQAGLILPGVTATAAEAEAFAGAWQLEARRRGTELEQRLTMTERLYEVDAPGPPPPAPGAARLATEDDVPLAASWLRSFHLEMAALRGTVDAEQVIRQRIANGWLVLWENGGEPVSMAGLHPAVTGVGRIGPVFTPGWHRRRGYAAAVTAAATRLNFEQGARLCMLYTNVADPTANGVYQSIGYRPVGEAAMIAFVPALPTGPTG